MNTQAARRLLRLAAHEKRFEAHRCHPVRARNLPRMLLAANCETLAASRAHLIVMGHMSPYTDHA